MASATASRVESAHVRQPPSSAGDDDRAAGRKAAAAAAVFATPHGASQLDTDRVTEHCFWREPPSEDEGSESDEEGGTSGGARGGGRPVRPPPMAFAPAHAREPPAFARAREAAYRTQVEAVRAQTERIVGALNEREFTGIVDFLSTCRPAAGAVPLAVVATRCNAQDQGHALRRLCAHLTGGARLTRFAVHLGASQCQTVHSALRAAASALLAAGKPADASAAGRPSGAAVSTLRVLCRWYALQARDAPAAGGGPPEPLVILISDAELVPPRALEDLLGAVAEHAAALPIALVAAVATTADAIARALPRGALARVRTRCFRLEPALGCLDEAVRRVLFEGCAAVCAPAHAGCTRGADAGADADAAADAAAAGGGRARMLGLELSPGGYAELRDAFLAQHLSVSSFEAQLAYAVLRHCMTQPLAFLSAAAPRCRAECLELCAALDGAHVACVRALPSVRRALEGAGARAEGGEAGGGAAAHAPPPIADAELRARAAEWVWGLQLHARAFSAAGAALCEAVGALGGAAGARGGGAEGGAEGGAAGAPGGAPAPAPARWQLSARELYGAALEGELGVERLLAHARAELGARGGGGGGGGGGAGGGGGSLLALAAAAGGACAGAARAPESVCAAADAALAAIDAQVPALGARPARGARPAWAEGGAAGGMAALDALARARAQLEGVRARARASIEGDTAAAEAPTLPAEGGGANAPAPTPSAAPSAHAAAAADAADADAGGAAPAAPPPGAPGAPPGASERRWGTLKRRHAALAAPIVDAQHASAQHASAAAGAGGGSAAARGCGGGATAAAPPSLADSLAEALGTLCRGCLRPRRTLPLGEVACGEPAAEARALRSAKLCPRVREAVADGLRAPRPWPPAAPSLSAAPRSAAGAAAAAAAVAAAADGEAHRARPQRAAAAAAESALGRHASPVAHALRAEHKRDLSAEELSASDLQLAHAYYAQAEARALNLAEWFCDFSARVELLGGGADAEADAEARVRAALGPRRKREPPPPPAAARARGRSRSAAKAAEVDRSGGGPASAAAPPPSARAPKRARTGPAPFTLPWQTVGPQPPGARACAAGSAEDLAAAAATETAAAPAAADGAAERATPIDPALLARFVAAVGSLQAHGLTRTATRQRGHVVKLLFDKGDPQRARTAL